MKLAVQTMVFLALLATAASAGKPEVVRAAATRTSDTWRIDVTVRHADAGWDHYADGWGVYAPDGTELGYRELLHPHDTEQPFTRSLTGVKIPAGIKRVILRAHDSVHGTGASFTLTLP